MFTGTVTDMLCHKSKYSRVILSLIILPRSKLSNLNTSGK